MDSALLARLVQGPGIDTRVWISLAAVRTPVMDTEEGPFAAVTLLPSELDLNVMCGAPYAGPGFGAYFPLEEGDTVLVGVPNGDWNLGPVVIARLWGKAEAPPSEAVSAPHDAAIVGGPGRNIVIRTQPAAVPVPGVPEGNLRFLVNALLYGGAAEIDLAADTTATLRAALKVRLGTNQDALLQPVIKGTAYMTALATFLTAMGTFVGLMGTAFGNIATAFSALSVTPPIGSPMTPNPTMVAAASASAAAGTGAATFATAITTFAAALTPSLSLKVFTE